ncbi:hypothetical protein AGMMS49938_13640 [Fibrobacterales bacterium]|nr:hypothetical protein AGMMS49938_13640 [Fibrobacterales bacterium]
MLLKKKLLRFFLIPALALALAAACFFVYLFVIVPNQDPDDKFNRETVLRNLSGESRVFYRDGNSVIGSFFDTNHRLYVPYDSIPQGLIDAIVSAEDADFWEHNGFDFSGFARAMFNNIRSLSFKQGGSTLTQQTVKNIFGREEKSLGAKWSELKDALRFEKHFTKHDILEFYLNQFQVYSSGRGAAIAALYFFNKNLKELSLTECAFIAGTVKGPYNYDPRVQKTPDRAKRALEKGENRTKYVLHRMLENGYISQGVFDSVSVIPPNLNYGEFRFNSSSLLEKVERELDGDFFGEIFSQYGIDDWRKSQIKIITTLDSGLQKNAENAVQENLLALQKKIGRDTVAECKSVANSEPSAAGLPNGQEQTRGEKCVEINPLQGALVALQNGMVVAAQSGQNNVGYDRVFTAQRQFGSSWKPLLYALALKFGWKPLDDLENEYNLFSYGGINYFPRPDHINRAPRVSIAWAAVRSENIATIWLLSHLLDKMSLEEIREIAADVEIPPVTELVKKQIAFEKAKNSLTTDLAFEGKFEVIRALEALKFLYDEKEVSRQKNDSIKVKLLKHSYNYYVNECDTFPEISADFDTHADDKLLFPNFTCADFSKLKNIFTQKLNEPITQNDMNYIFLLPDFRFKLAMREFAKFAKSIGINRNLQEVMSMPLGVNEATLAEMTTAYQTILSGKIFKCKDTEWDEPCLIKEIQGKNGETIFKNAVDSSEVLPSSVVQPMRAMLRAVFKYGTAISANSQIAIKYQGANYPFPAMGKTGTTNENRTAAFYGALPLDTLLAIGSYIGFDDNDKLKGKSRSLAGASGALPQWAEFAKNILSGSGKIERTFGESIDYINMIASGEVPLPNMPQYISVDRESGLPLDSLSANTRVAEFPEF